MFSPKELADFLKGLSAHAEWNDEVRGLVASAVTNRAAQLLTFSGSDYTLVTVDTTHFIIDERPDLVRTKLIEVAEETRR